MVFSGLRVNQRYIGKMRKGRHVRQSSDFVLTLHTFAMLAQVGLEQYVFSADFNI